MSANDLMLIDDADYAAIEAMLRETARGRAFLARHAQRSQGLDTRSLLDAIGRLESVVRDQRQQSEARRIRHDLTEMSQAIARTRAEIASIRPSTCQGGRIEQATEELDAIVRATESATGEILTAAEEIQEIGETLRARNDGEDLAGMLDGYATDIFTACSFQDITGQRTRKVVEVLRYLETRINAMIGIWGASEEGEEAPPATAAPASRPDDARPDAHLLNGPSRDGEGMSQGAVDTLIAKLEAAQASDVKTVAEAAGVPAADKAKLAKWLEGLDARERLSLFS